MYGCISVYVCMIVSMYVSIPVIICFHISCYAEVMGAMAVF